jgi:DNA-binding LacI/PurR family transcriptional regulator
MRSFDFLMEMIEGKTGSESKIISFEPELIIRESI